MIFNVVIVFFYLASAMLLSQAAPVPRHERVDAGMDLATRASKSANRVAIGQKVEGEGTYYATGMGACGIVSNDSQMVVAVSKYLFDNYPGATANPNTNPICGKIIKASYKGNSVKVKVVDRCASPDPDCLLHHLDFSPTAFKKLADPALGRIKVNWEWV